MPELPNLLMTESRDPARASRSGAPNQHCPRPRQRTAGRGQHGHARRLLPALGPGHEPRAAPPLPGRDEFRDRDRRIRASHPERHYGPGRAAGPRHALFGLERTQRDEGGRHPQRLRLLPQVRPRPPQEGLFFIDAGGTETRASLYSQILPKTIVAGVPPGLAAGSYSVAVRSLANGKKLARRPPRGDHGRRRLKQPTALVTKTYTRAGVEPFGAAPAPLCSALGAHPTEPADLPRVAPRT